MKQHLQYTQAEFGDQVMLELTQRLHGTFALLAGSPLIGRSRPELTSRAVRFFSVLPFVIVYKIKHEGIEIVTVVHGARDLRNILR